MANDDLDLDIAIAEEEAKAYEFQALASQRAPQPEREPNYGGAVWDGLSSLVTGPLQLGQAAALASQKHPISRMMGPAGPAASMAYEGGKYLYENPKAVAPTVGAGMSMAAGLAGSPALGALTAMPFQYAANRVNDYIWPEEAQSQADKEEQVIRDLTGSAAGALVPQGLKYGNKAATWALNQLDNAPATQQNTWRGAQRPGSTANVLDAGRGQPGRELQIVEDIKPYEGKFHQLKPYAGIEDVPGQSSVQRTRDVLSRQKDAALSQKQQVLDLVSERSDGISLDDLDLSALDEYGGGTFTEGAPYVKNNITSAFTTGPQSEWEKAMKISSPKKLHANQVQQMIRELDKEITKLGGYDDLLNAQAEFDPSKIAPQAEHLGALRAARNQLNEALNAHAGDVLGVANPLKEPNAVASTALEYDPLLQRWQNTIGQVLTPGSARSMTGPQSQQASAALSGTGGFLVNKLTGGWLQNRADQARIAKGLAADHGSVNKLQQYGAMRGQPMGPAQRGPVFDWVNTQSESFQVIMDALTPILPGLMSLDPSTGRIHDPAERRLSINAIQNSNAPLAQQARAVSDLNAGKLPAGIEQAPQQVQMPDIGMIAGAAERASGGDLRAQGFGPKTEDDRMMRQMQMLNEVDTERSGY